MKTVGIIAEFNPFHNGHRYLIEQAKTVTGADCCAVIMSGDYVQRGAPAVCNKYLRAEMALRCGADVVFELPAVFSLGSAESFAEGAVNLLCATSQTDFLCFGSESGNTEDLIKCASQIEGNTASPSFKEELSSLIKSGVSYPSAFSKALTDSLGSLQQLLLSPNNLLGIEYIRALLRIKKLYGTSPEPVTIKRIGSDHFDTVISDFSSAASIRDYLYRDSDLTKLSGSLPKETLNILSSNYHQLLPMTEEDFSSMLYMRLNSMTDEEILSLPDINRDLLHKLLSFKGQRISIPELIMNLKSKCFTYTSISRSLFRLLLFPFYSEAVEYLKAASNESKPYLRVLGFKKESSLFLRTLRNSETIDVITKPADGPLSNPCYALDIYAANLYEQAVFNKFKTGFTEEIKTGPVII